jgi:hypothetical protein
MRVWHGCLLAMLILFITAAAGWLTFHSTPRGALTLCTLLSLILPHPLIVLQDMML